jgi:aspartyl-tRNA(Asn)/glutamyl-tRNA(Gln) amidotransferase subunit A
MARSAEDCALLLDVIAQTRTVPALAKGVTGLRVGALHAFSAEACASNETVAAMEAALQVFTRLGAIVETARSPTLFDLDACGRVILLAEVFAEHEARLRTEPANYGRIARLRFALGGYLSAADYLHAAKRRLQLTAEMDRLFEVHDLLVTVGEAAGAPRFEQASAFFGFTAVPSLRMPFTLTGSPALSIPCGFDTEGLPLAIQIAAPRGRDDRVLAAAAAFQSETDWHSRRPPI